jgi:plastocyanin domain-containing protein
MEPEARQAIADIHGRIDDLKDQFYKSMMEVTKQMERMATTMEHNARPKEQSVLQTQIIKALVTIGQMGLVGLFLFWLSHREHIV